METFPFFKLVDSLQTLHGNFDNKKKIPETNNEHKDMKKLPLLHACPTGQELSPKMQNLIQTFSEAKQYPILVQ